MIEPYRKHRFESGADMIESGADMKYQAENVLQAALKTYQSVSDDKHYCMSKASMLICDAARNDGYNIDELKLSDTISKASIDAAVFSMLDRDCEQIFWQNMPW